MIKFVLTRQQATRPVHVQNKKLKGHYAIIRSYPSQGGSLSGSFINKLTNLLINAVVIVPSASRSENRKGIQRILSENNGMGDCSQNAICYTIKKNFNFTFKLKRQQSEV